MGLSSLHELKGLASAPRRLGAVLGPRRSHGSMGWMSLSSTDDNTLYQPQDGSSEIRGRVAEIASRLLRMTGEPEDARITGGTRSLMRRLSGLNIGKNVRHARPVAAAKSVAKGLQLTNANVA